MINSDEQPDNSDDDVVVELSDFIIIRDSDTSEILVKKRG